MAVALTAMLVGAAVMVGCWIASRHHAQRALDDFLGMTPIPRADSTGDGVGPVTGMATDLAAHVVARLDRTSSLGRALEMAKVPLRPGEFAVVTTGFGLGVAAVLLLVTKVAVLAGMGAIAVWIVASAYVRRRIARRRGAFEAQLPDALALIASSLSAGHTFLRAIQMMCEESPPPMNEEFAVVVTQSQLGDSLVDALEGMARRLQIRDLDIVVQAIRIQQTVGGRLADLLHTLSDFIRARDEVRREVKVLTAEGRMSAYVLTGLVPFLLLTMQVLNPGYAAPLFKGAGLIILGFSGASVGLGLVVIMRMVKIDF